MITIGICDDVPEVLEELGHMISEVLNERVCEYKIEKFSTGEKALFMAARLNILFLDIEMPEMDGIAVGEQIHKMNEDCKIIMATARVDRFKEAFKIRAFRFITKPFDIEELTMVLDEAIDLLSGTKTVKLHLNRIPYDIQQGDIVYVKAYESYVGAYVKNGKMMRKDISLSKMFSLLDERLFYRVARGYIINLSFIEFYRKGVLKIADLEIGIPRMKKKDFEKRYEEYCFKYR